MALISTAILILTYFSFFIGQIFRINLFNTSFPLIDIAIVLLASTNLAYHLKQKKIKPTNTYLAYFLIYAWIILFINLIRFQIYSLKPIFYLVRLSSLLSLIILPLGIKNKTKNIFILFVIANIFFGLIQYFFWPDFTYFNVNNWDPHLYRLISTYFDPTFTGLIYLFFIIKLFLNQKMPYRWPLIIISYIAMSLTYSRSTFLSFLVAFGFIAFTQKKVKIFLSSILVILFTLMLLPRHPGEGTKLERTSSVYAKIENYKDGFRLFKQSPIIGVGYNNLPLVRNENQYSHAISGFDSSLLTILTTTGIIGLFLFLLGFTKFFSSLDLFKKTMIIAIFVHSLFANSLLYPWILISLILY